VSGNDPLEFTLARQATDRANSLYSCSMCTELVKQYNLQAHASMKHGVQDFVRSNTMVRRIRFALITDETWLSDELIFKCDFPGCGEMISGDLLERHALSHDAQIIILDEASWRVRK
jgi:hypothetical protein